MAVAFGSVTTATVGENSGDSSQITLTKPTGLADGDFMVGIISFGDQTESTAFELSGWTELFHRAYLTQTVTVLWKVASAADAAASDFTFTVSSGDERQDVCGSLFRITGSGFTGAGNIFDSDNDTDTGASVSFSSGVTPGDSGILLLMGGAGGAIATATGSTYAVANNNPSWTERVEISSNEQTDTSQVVATATSTDGGATGAYSFTWSQDTGGTIGFLLAIEETTNAAVTGVSGTLNLEGKIGSVSAGASVTGTSGTLNLEGKTGSASGGTSEWNNTDKTGTASVINTPKS